MGNLGIRIASMVVQEDTDAYVELNSANDPETIEIHSDGITLKERKRTDKSTFLTLSFHGRGQKSLRLLYNGKRWTNLHFFCVEDAEQLVKARARFMAERQFVVNPHDPYHRHHMFLPFDYRRATRLDDNDDVWEVGGTDDPGFGDPVFLVEEFVHSRVKVGWKCSVRLSVQAHPEPRYLRDMPSLYWKVRTPESVGSWSKKRVRPRGEPSICLRRNIYHGMYRIGRDTMFYRIARRSTISACHET